MDEGGFFSIIQIKEEQQKGVMLPGLSFFCHLGKEYTSCCKNSWINMPNFFAILQNSAIKKV